MRKASLATAAVRLEDLRRLVAALPEDSKRNAWFCAQEQALAGGKGALALGLMVDDDWFRRLSRDGTAWCDESELLSWTEESKEGAAIVAVVTRAESLQEEWSNARSMVVDEAEHEILVLAYG
ncbi:MAG: hypothetical protein E6R08_00460 [Nevskiaceae bacterium]|nr:MAG: hypothetical protein E6R08_00460 [Nevskiaceae bacterium]